MNRDIDIDPRAQKDVFRIVGWLTKRSPRGARSWYRAFWTAAENISADPEKYCLVDETPKLRRAVRHAIFKTRRGRFYRIIFEHSAEAVFILRVRRAGQRPLRRRDLPDA